jgi:hypothetical protein
MNKLEIRDWIYNHKVFGQTINDDLTVDVDCTVDIMGMEITEFPFQFGIIYGDFDCSNNKLTSLKNCPRHVRGNFCCYNNYNLSSIKELLEIRIDGGVYVGKILEQTPEYKLMMKIKSL